MMNSNHTLMCDLTVDQFPDPLVIQEPTPVTASSSASSVFSHGGSDTAASSASPEVLVLDHKLLDHKPVSEHLVSKILKSGEDSKAAFVETLVDSAVMLIDAIWQPAKGASIRGRSMPLKRFIQETLKRSRTSYSTFQVSLYYLILVKPIIYKLSTVDALASSPLHCARRTFLASLMLASKCLQDRNYSISAWSKISGLSIKELTSNEIEFLKSVDWKLHMAQDVYNRWSSLLLFSASESADMWKRRIKNIGPDLVVKDMCFQRPSVVKVIPAPSSAMPTNVPSTKASEELVTPPSACASQTAAFMSSEDEWAFIRKTLHLKQQLKARKHAVAMTGRPAVTPMLATPAPSFEPSSNMESILDEKESVSVKRQYVEVLEEDEDDDITILDVRPCKRTVLHNVD